MSQRKIPRSAGVLLHPTSLPGPYGIGDLGPAAYRWIDSLANARQTLWQILPLGPTGYGDSPYQCFSAFAGNPYLVSPEFLVRDGLLRNEEIDAPAFQANRVDYGKVIPFKLRLLRQAHENFTGGQAGHLRSAFEAFREEQADWLDDYSLFMALKEARKGESWLHWPRELLYRDGDRKMVDFARRELQGDIDLQQFSQFLFFRQWRELRAHAKAKGVKIIGDAPIFVASDSADVWANTKLFLLDGQMKPKVQAGVPPDYFSPTGQLWGNPIYDWEAMAGDGYAWWVRRMQAVLDLVDYVRLDHFRGFGAAWHVPAGRPTAEVGDWVPGPGADLFEHFRSAIPDLPIIAEDLGEITPDVYALRDRYGLPGMKILQFAFDKPSNVFLPHNFPTSNCVVYTGTHDNDTTRGWMRTMPEHERWLLTRYLGRPPAGSAWELIPLGWASVADMAITPFQDVLDLGPEARMNTPGKPDDNWQWRCRIEHFDDPGLQRLADLTELYNRSPK